MMADKSKSWGLKDWVEVVMLVLILLGIYWSLGRMYWNHEYRIVALEKWRQEHSTQVGQYQRKDVIRAYMEEIRRRLDRIEKRLDQR